MIERSRRLETRPSMSECSRCNDVFVTRSEGSVPVCARCETSTDDGGFWGFRRWTFGAICSLCLVVLVFMLGSSESRSVSHKLSEISSHDSSFGQQARALSGKYLSGQSMVNPVLDKTQLAVTESTSSEQGESITAVDSTASHEPMIIRASEASGRTQTDIPRIETAGDASHSGEPRQYAVYMIVEGDSLYAIAEKFLPDGAFLHEFTKLVMQENGIENFEALQVGMELKIPLDLNKED